MTCGYSATTLTTTIELADSYAYAIIFTAPGPFVHLGIAIKQRQPIASQYRMLDLSPPSKTRLIICFILGLVLTPILQNYIILDVFLHNINLFLVFSCGNWRNIVKTVNNTRFVLRLNDTNLNNAPANSYLPGTGLSWIMKQDAPGRGPPIALRLG